MKENFILEFKEKIEKFAAGRPEAKQQFEQEQNASYIGEYVERVDVTGLTIEQIVAITEIVYESQTKKNYEVYDIQLVTFAKNVKAAKIKEGYVWALLDVALFEIGKKAIFITKNNTKLKVDKALEDRFVKVLTTANTTALEKIAPNWFEKEFKNHLDSIYGLYRMLSKIDQEHLSSKNRMFLLMVSLMKTKKVTPKSDTVKEIVKELGMTELEFYKIYFEVIVNSSASDISLRPGEIEAGVMLPFVQATWKKVQPQNELLDEMLKLYNILESQKWWYSDRITFSPKGKNEAQRILNAYASCEYIAANKIELMAGQPVNSVYDYAMTCLDSDVKKQCMGILKFKAKQLTDEQLLGLNNIDEKLLKLTFEEVKKSYSMSYAHYLRLLKLGIGEYTINEWADKIIEMAVEPPTEKGHRRSYDMYLTDEVYEATQHKTLFKALKLREEVKFNSVTPGEYSAEEIGLWFSIALVQMGEDIVVKLLQNEVLLEGLNMDGQWLFDQFFKESESVPGVNTEENARLQAKYGSQMMREKAKLENEIAFVRMEFKELLNLDLEGEAYGRLIELKGKSVFPTLKDEFEKQINKKCSEQTTYSNYYNRRGRGYSYSPYVSKSEQTKKDARLQHYDNLKTIINIF